MKRVGLILVFALVINGLARNASARTPQTAAGQATNTPSPDTSKKKKPGGSGGTDTLVIDGFFAENGTQFVSAKDGKTWKVTNPEDLKAKQGHKVRVVGSFDSARNELQVKGVSSIPAEAKKEHPTNK